MERGRRAGHREQASVEVKGGKLGCARATAGRRAADLDDDWIWKQRNLLVTVIYCFLSIRSIDRLRTAFFARSPIRGSVIHQEATCRRATSSSNPRTITFPKLLEKGHPNQIVGWLASFGSCSDRGNQNEEDRFGAFQSIRKLPNSEVHCCAADLRRKVRSSRSPIDRVNNRGYMAFEVRLESLLPGQEGPLIRGN